MDTLTANVWDDDFENDLTCLFLSYAEVAIDGTVTFQYGNLQNAIFSLGNYDAERILLCWQAYYFLSIIGADGLNAAGATTAIENPVCSCGSWGREWLFAELVGSEWTKLQGMWTVEEAIEVSGDWTGRFAAVTCRVNIPAETTIVQVGIRCFVPAGQYGQSGFVYRASADTGFIHSGNPDTLPYSDTIGFTELYYSADLYRITTVEQFGDDTERQITAVLRHQGVGTLRGIRIWGTGPCPFTTGAVL
jgi:hypothetical protein